jgi:hypothetical protein
VTTPLTAGIRAHQVATAIAAGAGALVTPGRAWACTVCVGTTDSSLFTGMNLGVLTLAGITLLVLGAFGAFFVRLGHRARVVAAATRARTVTEGQRC